MLPYGALWKLDHALHPPAPPQPPTRALRRRRALFVFCLCIALVTLFLVPYHVTYLRRLRLSLEKTRQMRCVKAQREEATQWLMHMISNDMEETNNTVINEIAGKEEMKTTKDSANELAAPTRDNVQRAWMAAMYGATQKNNINEEGVSDYEKAVIEEEGVRRFDTEYKAVAEAYATRDTKHYAELVKDAPWLRLVAPLQPINSDNEYALLDNVPAIHQLLNGSSYCLGSLWLPQRLNVSALQAEIDNAVHIWQSTEVPDTDKATLTLVATLLTLASTFDTALPQGIGVAGLARIFNSCLVDVSLKDGVHDSQPSLAHSPQVTNDNNSVSDKEDKVWCLCRWSSNTTHDVGMLDATQIVHQYSTPADFTGDVTEEPRHTCAGICLIHQELKNKAVSAGARQEWLSADETSVRLALREYMAAHKKLYES